MVTKRLLFTVFVLLVAFTAWAVAGEPEGAKTDRLQKRATNDSYGTILINNIFNYYSNNGDGSYNIYTGNSGLEWPKGSNNTAVFQDGLVWGGMPLAHARQIRVGGSTYRHGLQAGRILSVGVADDPGKATNRMFRVRPDVSPAMAFDAAMETKLQGSEVIFIQRNEGGITAQDIYDQYVSDWNEWPATEGAPFEDKNGNGTYEPAVDVPGVPGADQTLWHVSNDLAATRTTFIYGSNPIGIEMQRTIWAYNRVGALGNVTFARYKVINKSGAVIDSMFFSQWSDPDLGDSGDDVAGCDTTRDLGYVYNGRARDSYYGEAPPASGYDFFQGPIIPSPGNTAVFDNKYKADYENLPMSAFVFFLNSGGAYGDPGLGNYTTGTLGWWNLFQGKIASNGGDFIDPVTGLPTKFLFAGDPQTQRSTEAWIDGYDIPPGDRRICLVTGPFTMAADDTQEVVVATLVGQGGDRISSIGVLKFYSDQAQAAFDALFDLPQPPAKPLVSVAELDGEVVLDWSDKTRADETELLINKGYEFQGYKVYQARNVSGEGFVELGVFDLVDGTGKIFDMDYDASSGVVLNKPVQNGNDNGVRRTFDITDDKIRSRKLINGWEYYFAVTAYSYNPLGIPKTLESPREWFRVVPQSLNPGARFGAEYDQVVPSVHATGVASTELAVTVVNPEAVKPANYKVGVIVTDSVFNADLGVNVANPKWFVQNVTSGDTVLKASTAYGIDLDNKVADGLRIGLDATPFYVAGAEIASAPYTGAINFDGVNWGGTTLHGGLDVGYWFFGSSLEPQQVSRDIEFRFNSAATQNAYVFRRAVNSTASGGAVYQGLFPQPFTVWDVTNPASPRQVDFVFIEMNESTTNSTWTRYRGNRIWDIGYQNDREYMFISDNTYSATDQYSLTAGTSTFSGVFTTTHPVLYAGWFRVLDTTKATFADGDVWKINSTKVLNTTDSWTFSTIGLEATSSSDLAKEDVEKVNVFPNPYFGVNNMEPSKYLRFVTFNHLPRKATVRIFTLAGVLVRTIVKDDDTQFLRWDLNNSYGLPVAAGMFVAHVDMPDLGKTKILKLAVIPEAQILDKL